MPEVFNIFDAREEASTQTIASSESFVLVEGFSSLADAAVGALVQVALADHFATVSRLQGVLQQIGDDIVGSARNEFDDNEDKFNMPRYAFGEDLDDANTGLRSLREARLDLYRAFDLAQKALFLCFDDQQEYDTAVETTMPFMVAAICNERANFDFLGRDLFRVAARAD